MDLDRCFRSLWRAALSVVAVLAAVTAAAAAPITLVEASVSGDLLVCQRCGLIMNPLSLQLQNVELNGTPSNIVGPLLVFGGAFGFGVHTDGATTYEIAANDPNSGSKQLIDSGGAGRLADFGLDFTRAIVGDTTPQMVTLYGTERLLFDVTSDAFDFSPFLAGGVFTLTLSTAAGNFNELFTAGGSLPVSGSLAQSAATVPEPASLLLLAPAVAAGWRRRTARRNPPDRSR